MLQKDPGRRLGSGDGDSEEIKNHPYFDGINWNDIYNRRIKPPKPKKKIHIPELISSDMFVDTHPQAEEQKVEGWSFVQNNQIAEEDEDAEVDFGPIQEE